MSSIIYLIVYISILTNSIICLGQDHFVKVKDGKLTKNGSLYRFIGTNFWQAVNLAGSENLNDRLRFIREIDHLKKLGIKNIRILGISEGPTNEPFRIQPAMQNTPGILDDRLLNGLDIVISELRKRDMTAVICLTNYWHWSGGMSQWVSWVTNTKVPYPSVNDGNSWNVFRNYSSKFFDLPSNVHNQFNRSISKLILRKNKVTNIYYKDDPTIMSWELANEPRAGKDVSAYLRWVENTSKFIKAIDSKHLITIGSEGEYTDGIRKIAEKEHSIKTIDYITVHLWVENFQIYNPRPLLPNIKDAITFMKKFFDEHVEISLKLNKPLVIEEFGLARDMRKMTSDATTVFRDKFFEEVFQYVINEYNFGNGVIGGVNFWAWSGEATPSPGLCPWERGDGFTGDPPHEEQGWYSVFSSDKSTLGIIQRYASIIGNNWKWKIHN